MSWMPLPKRSFLTYLALVGRHGTENRMAVLLQHINRQMTIDIRRLLTPLRPGSATAHRIPRICRRQRIFYVVRRSKCSYRVGQYQYVARWNAGLVCTKGTHRLPRSEFMTEVRSLHEQLMSLVHARIDSVLSDALPSTTKIDLKALKLEHSIRSRSIERHFSDPIQTDWGGRTYLDRTNRAGRTPSDVPERPTNFYMRICFC